MAQVIWHSNSFLVLYISFELVQIVFYLLCKFIL